MWSIILFFVLQFVNVVLSTMRSVLTVTANKHISVIANTVSYTFYSAIVKLMTGQDMWVVVAATFITNILGVYLADFILNKMKKDKLWKFEIAVPIENNTRFYIGMLKSNIPYTKYVSSKYVIYHCYCATQNESKIIMELAKKFNANFSAYENKLF